MMNHLLNMHRQVTEQQRKELDRILNLSFNPLATSLPNPLITERDKALLWELRYGILNRANLLPAFVMSMQW